MRLGCKDKKKLNLFHALIGKKPQTFLCWAKNNPYLGFNSKLNYCARCMEKNHLQE